MSGQLWARSSARENLMKPHLRKVLQAVGALE